MLGRLLKPFVTINKIIYQQHSMFSQPKLSLSYNCIFNKWKSNSNLAKKLLNFSFDLTRKPFKVNCLCKLLGKGIFGYSSGVVLLHLFQSKGADHVICRIINTDPEKPTENLEFPYSEFFWTYLLPELFPLTIAIIAALLGAAVNMKIPIAIGDLINLLNDSLQQGLREAGDYYNTLKGPVLELIKFYLLQGFTTFAYISCLSHVGENISAKMRKDIFRSYLQQDVAFHDQHKTGALIDRLTSDVQVAFSASAITENIRQRIETLSKADRIDKKFSKEAEQLSQNFGRRIK